LHYEIDEIAHELEIHPFVWCPELTPASATPLLKKSSKASAAMSWRPARKMPMLRDLVVARVIKRNARQNLVIAMASTLPSSLPWVGPIIGLLGVTGELIFLTSNQLKMVLQIAGAYE